MSFNFEFSALLAPFGLILIDVCEWDAYQYIESRFKVGFVLSREEYFLQRFRFEWSAGRLWHL